MKTIPASLVVIVCCAVMGLAGGAQPLMEAPRSGQTPQQPPKFQSSVEVTPVDVIVVDDHGKPIQNLAPADFTVRVDGNARRVVSAEWMSLVTEEKTKPAAPVPEGFSSNENATGGRLIMIAIDEPNIRFGAALAVSRAAAAFVDHLLPSDRVAAIGLGVGSPATPFTADRERVKEAIRRMVGQKRMGVGTVQFNIALSEAIAMASGDRSTDDLVVARECRTERTPQAYEACRQQVDNEAMQIAQEAQQSADLTMRGLRNVLLGLRGIDAPKTLILMSEGFVMDGTSSEVADLGAMAAAARTSMYALQLDENAYDVTQARVPTQPLADRRSRSEGLELLAGAARGTLFTVTGSGALLFDRIEAELEGYYLLGVESDARDRDGKSHSVRVDVPRRGAIVRARRQMLAPTTADVRPRSPREAVTAALSSPLLLPSLPLRVATFSLQGPERTKVQVLIHADVGHDFTGPRRVAIGYTITAGDGRLVDSHTADTRLATPMSGVPSPLEYVAGASVAPGEYTLKLAVADGDRTGSIEHPIHASLIDAGSIRLSELMVGGPVSPDVAMRPTIGYTASYGSVHAYVEAYGPQIESLKVKYEIAADQRSEAILTAEVAPRLAGEGRALFTQVMPVRALPAGKYFLRAVVSAGDETVKTLTRAFEVAPPAVLMTSAAGVGDSASSDGELFLPVDEATLAGPFRREDAVKAATLDPFRARLAPETREAFDKGVLLLTAGDYSRAEMSFKAAIQTDTDSTPALAYLAACFAASGHDTEAASAWQTALVDGSEMPQIYQWLADALLRTHSLGEARSVLEEAVGRWPSDARFTRPLAMVYATFGKAREAVRTLERYIAAGYGDAESLSLGVEWIYQVHAAGGVVHTRAEDLKIAHTFADQYAKANGPKVQLVRQWLDFLDRGKR